MAGAVCHMIGVGSAASSSTPIPNFANVIFLIYGEGSDGNTTFTDHSTIGRTVTPNGNVQHDTGVNLNGQSVLFDGAGDWLSMADATDIHFVTSTDFCLEAWVRTTDLSHINTIMNKRDTTSAEEGSFGINTDGSIYGLTYGAGAVRLSCSTSSGLISANTDYHVAFTREGTTGRIFIDGSLVATATQSGTVENNTATFKIGRDGFNTARDFEGSMNWMRFVKGEALYTADFVPPTSMPTS